VSLIALLIIACNSSTTRKSSELITLLQGGDLFAMRMVESNTGIFKGEHHLKAHMWKKKQTPMSLGLKSTPKDGSWDQYSRTISGNFLRYEDNKWIAKVQSNEFNFRLHSSVTMEGCSSNEDDWSATVLQLSGDTAGWLQADKQSAPLNGISLLVEHQGYKSSPEEKKWLIAQSSEVAFFYESWGDFSFGCAEIFGDRFIIDNDSVAWQPTGATITIDKWQINIQYEERIAMENPYEHVSSGERMVASAIYPSSPIYWYSAVAEIKGQQTMYVPMILRFQGEQAPELPKSRKR
jgi:hypothetical protein